jgi:hypothetical protein
MALLADVFVLLYFGLFGWLCEIDLCHCHEEFLIEGLSKKIMLMLKLKIIIQIMALIQNITLIIKLMVIIKFHFYF